MVAFTVYQALFQALYIQNLESSQQYEVMDNDDLHFINAKTELGGDEIVFSRLHD